MSLNVKNTQICQNVPFLKDKNTHKYVDAQKTKQDNNTKDVKMYLKI